MRNPLAPWMADDTFANGGDLVDTDGPWAGRDKVQHLVLGGLLWFVLWGVRIPLGPRVVLMVAAVVLWECIELARYLAWQAKGAPRPWPLVTDKFSWRDCVAGLAGAGLVQGALWLHAVLPFWGR
jgi:hypothetical protein